MAKKSKSYKDVYIVDGSRTPFLKAKGRPGPFAASDLAFLAGRPLLSRQSFTPDDLDEVILGCVIPGPDEANIARIVALRLGCGYHVPAWTVQRNCASGMQALDCAARSISSGRSHLVIAGGTEAMSHSPLLLNRTMVDWLSDFNRARSWKEKIICVGKLRPGHFKPVISLLCGLTDPIVGLSMGQTAEVLAHKFNIQKEEMDRFSLESHQRLANAQDKGHLNEIETIYDSRGKYYDQDLGLRRDTTMESLGKLKPVFDKKVGKVTAGNSAQVTDGAALLILASKEAVKKYHLPVLGIITDCSWAALDPAQMGLGPAHAIADLTKKHSLSLGDIDYWEINEAFAGQVLACLKVLQDTDYCQNELGLKNPFGEIAMDTLNLDGGGISLGHPIGASGARIVLHLLHVLKSRNGTKGIASLCIGGGQGGAMLVERAEG